MSWINRSNDSTFLILLKQQVLIFSYFAPSFKLVTEIVLAFILLYAVTVCWLLDHLAASCSNMHMVE